jgi:hypothetical protein
MVRAALRTQTRVAPPLSFTPVAGGFLQRKCSCGGTPGPTGECESCGKKKLQRRSENLDLSSISHPRSSVSEVPSIVHEVLRSPGQPLDSETRAFMEPRFGHDFSQVRVHTDSLAAESARAVDALAYTVGRDLVFNAGLYQPATPTGRNLLAHELTHVIQQKDEVGSPSTIEIGASDDSFEEEADRYSAAAVGGDAPSHVSAKRKSLQRDVGWAQRPRPPGGDDPSPYGTARAPWGVVITKAELMLDFSIGLLFGPDGKVGTLTLEFLRSGMPPFVLLRGVTRSAGETTERFNIPTLPVGQIHHLRATWIMDGHNYVSIFPKAMRVLGMFLHSQYNIPTESSCAGTTVPAYITDSSCHFVPTTLLSGFVNQVNRNGSGRSTAHGNLQREDYCLRHPGHPADAAERSFRTTTAFHGGCGGPLNNSTVANCQTRPDLRCNDRVLIHGHGIKTVTDYCPACCRQNQLDNFTTDTACAGIVDLGRFMTIKLS